MQLPQPCKRCLLEEMETEQPLYELIRQRIALLPDGERTPDPEYRRRLALCRACDQLQRGTCLQCGCYVEIRAAKHLLHCPNSRPAW